MLELRTRLVAAALAVLPVTAHAHAHLNASIPAENAAVPAPDEVSLRFTQALEKNFSSVEVHDAGGHRVDDGKLRTAGDPAAIGIGLPKLAPGRYEVIWHATSVDTHRTEGKFFFSVVP